MVTSAAENSRSGCITQLLSHPQPCSLGWDVGEEMGKFQPQKGDQTPSSWAVLWAGETQGECRCNC